MVYCLVQKDSIEFRNLLLAYSYILCYILYSVSYNSITPEQALGQCKRKCVGGDYQTNVTPRGIFGIFLRLQPCDPCAMLEEILIANGVHPLSTKDVI